MTAFLARLREPSTYAGLAVVLALFGINVAPEAWSAIVQAISAAAGLAAVVLREQPR